MECHQHHAFARLRRPQLGNASNVVDHVSSALHTVAVMVSAAKLCPELKSNSDMLPATHSTIPSSRSLTDPVYPLASIPDHGFLLLPQAPVSAQCSYIHQWFLTRSAYNTY